MERQNDGTYIKKGPWTAEEDEVLLNYVRKYGPKGWSSIRSMGLLPRTGKSCRLRWVNKLRPNLKTGCKFSAEEERVVIELQAQFGNKWAKIATYLPGRTDNDVKNFWSARRKRLERILQSPVPKSSEKNKGKTALLHETPIVEFPPCSIDTGSSSCGDKSRPFSLLGNPEEFKMVPLPALVKPDLLSLETEFPILEVDPIQAVPFAECSVDYSFYQLPQPQQLLDLPILPECQEFASSNYNFSEIFDHLEASSKPEMKQKSSTSLPPLGLESSSLSVKTEDEGHPETQDSFFDEFSSDILDLEPFPSSSSVY